MGVTDFDGVPVADWIIPRLKWARKHGWTGKVKSGYRSNTEQTMLYREWQAGTRAGPVAKPGQSNHEGKKFPRGAVDVSQPYELAKVMKKWPGKNPLVWFGEGDIWHFSSTGH